MGAFEIYYTLMPTLKSIYNPKSTDEPMSGNLYASSFDMVSCSSARTIP